MEKMNFSLWMYDDHYEEQKYEIFLINICVRMRKWIDIFYSRFIKERVEIRDENGENGED